MECEVIWLLLTWAVRGPTDGRDERYDDSDGEGKPTCRRWVFVRR